MLNGVRAMLVKNATSSRQGPLVTSQPGHFVPSLCSDLQQAMGCCSAFGSTVSMPTVIHLRQACSHPLLVVGAGANRKLTSNMLRKFVDEIGIPFCDTMMGKGVIDSRARPRPARPARQGRRSMRECCQGLCLRDWVHAQRRASSTGWQPVDARLLVGAYHAWQPARAG